MSLPILENEVELQGKAVDIFAGDFKSKVENAEAPILNKELSSRFWSIYQPDRASPLYSPLLFESFNGLPRTYLQACGLDPYRDGCKIYETLVREAGGETRMDIYDGLPHAFWVPYPNISATKKWLNDSVTGIAWLLRSGECRNLVASKI